MKRYLIFIVLIIIIVTFTSCFKGDNSRGTLSKDSNSDAYNYPIKPGTEKWKTLSSHDEMIKACQIPEDILKSMSTTGLIETVLEYPLFYDIYAYNGEQQGFEALYKQFNGLPELLKRKDAGKYLLDRYCIMDPLAIEDTWSDSQKGDYVSEIYYIELLLSHQNILTSFTDEQKRDLLKEANKKLSGKLKKPETFSDTNNSYTKKLIEKIKK